MTSCAFLGVFQNSAYASILTSLFVFSRTNSETSQAPAGIERSESRHFEVFSVLLGLTLEVFRSNKKP